MIRSFVLRALPLVGLIFVGAVVLAAAGDDTVGFAIGLTSIGVAAVLLVALFFYEVGRSENRARESQHEGSSQRGQRS